MFIVAHSEQAVVAHACHGHRYRPAFAGSSVQVKKAEIQTFGLLVQFIVIIKYIFIIVISLCTELFVFIASAPRLV